MMLYYDKIPDKTQGCFIRIMVKIRGYYEHFNAAFIRLDARLMNAYAFPLNGSRSKGPATLNAGLSTMPGFFNHIPVNF